jgi:cytochrome c peroxidase
MRHALLSGMMLAALIAAPAIVARADSTSPPSLRSLPAVPIPASNPMREDKLRLGRMLFFDPRLSGDASTSCASCHVPQLGWAHNDALARGYPGHRLWRNNPTVLNAAYYTRLMWDGTLDSLEAQARAAMQAPVEGNGKASMVEMRLRFIPEYVALFRQVYGDAQPQLDHAWEAIAAFERTLISDPRRVPFDRYLAGEENALSASARRGLALFQGKAGCIQCHSGPLASDESFHALGVPRQPLYDSHPLVQIAVRWQNAQRGAMPAMRHGQEEDLGRYYGTHEPTDIGKFRTPTLRELKYTAPYMHNGALTTLREVVDFFNAGGGEAPHKSPLLKPLGLNEQEKTDLIAFLESLSMEQPLLMDAPPLPPMQPLQKSDATARRD